MNLSIINTTTLTMSSLEIAELTGKRHDNVMRDIREMFNQLDQDIDSNRLKTEFLERINNLGLPVKDKHYLLTKDESLCLVAGYSAALRMAIIKRWQELEAKQQVSKIPQTYAAALLEAGRLALELEKKEEQLTQANNVIAINAPKADFADRVAGDDKGVLIGNFARTVGIGQNTLFRILRDERILMDGGNRHNLPFQEYLDRSYFTVSEKPYEVHGETRIGFQPMITGKGQQWLAKRLIDLGYLKPIAV
ncbi:Phage antirepressor protein YoqD, KilAC domain [Aeromonas sp. RU39B]|uniref:phage antirepressor KilAC domain-containing protein n=1 Tax=Aeromonas sp. RU39B TaxID=1907416 RepID=UPI000954FF89|nr:phage regulatory protein/antirepressor Ant [Aeromonas sp. RU39B]SIR65903.1 Phage antirepressor protein YoqD, KilAC domain [Aeromonas sp. RU39B]